MGRYIRFLRWRLLFILIMLELMIVFFFLGYLIDPDGYKAQGFFTSPAAWLLLLGCMIVIGAVIVRIIQRERKRE